MISKQDAGDAPRIPLGSRAKNNSRKDWFDEICMRFDEGVKEVERMFDILDRIEAGKEKVLRAQIIMLVSTLDFFVHEVFTYGLFQILNYEGNWRNSKSDGETDQESQGDLNTSLRYMDVKFEVLDSILNKSLCLEKISELLYDIRTSPSNVTPSGIRNNLKMINVNIDFFEDDLFKGIKDLSDKRNVIVHNAGMDVKSGRAIELNESDIRSGIKMVEDVGEIIKEAIRIKDSGN